MVRVILAQLRRRRGRAVALLIGMLAATTGFTVLTADSSTARLRVTSVVNANSRGVYDILVRPSGTRTALENGRDLVAPDFLSGQYGGISLAQWHRIQAVPGVSVAAPVAMVGYAIVDARVTVDLTASVDHALATQVLRLDRTWSADHGLSALADPAAQYVYVTRRPVIWSVASPDNQDPAAATWSDGQRRPATNRCGGTPAEPVNDPIEVEPDGTERMLCLSHIFPGAGVDAQYPRLTVAQMLPDGRFRLDGTHPPVAGLTVPEVWPLPLLLAGIDPASEASLVGLDQAVTSGSYLDAPAAAALAPRDTGTLTLPVLATERPGLDETLTVGVDRLAVPAGSDVVSPGWSSPRPAPPAVLGTAPATRLTSTAYRADTAYDDTLTGAASSGGAIADMSGRAFTRPGPAVFTVDPDGSLRPVTATPADPTTVAYGIDDGPSYPLIPRLFGDTPFRTQAAFAPVLSTEPGDPGPVLRQVGTFDPALIHGPSGLAGESLQVYQAPQLTGADPHSTDLLDGGALGPDGNTAGYVATPPALLTTLAGVEKLGIVDPISAVRVRVAGVTGVDPLSRERVRIAAQRIAEATGLDVDVTVGSSPQPQTIDLAAGRYGRPALTLTEGWTRKGVAVGIVQALDRKSLVLFVLILVVCALFLGNAVSAVVRDRRGELALLACLGWPRRRLASLVLGEVVTVGLVAGALSAAVALPVASLAGVSFPGTHALLAIPVAVGLALVVAALPALRAARIRAASSLYPAARAPRRLVRGRHRTIAGMAAANLRRTPARTLLGAAALGIGVAAVTVLVAINGAFHGAITGTLLGDAITLQVRGVDTVAVAAIVVLGLIAVGDVIYLGVRERAAEFAALRAAGWGEPALARLVAYEGIGVGALGVVAGAACGLFAAGRFAGQIDARLVWLTVGVAVAGLVLTALAAAVPAAMQRRLPVARLLAEE